MYDLDALSSKIDAHSAKWIKNPAFSGRVAFGHVREPREKRGILQGLFIYLNGKGNREGAYGNRRWALSVLSKSGAQVCAAHRLFEKQQNRLEKAKKHLVFF